MFWDKFVNLCIANNTKPNPVAKELGLSSGSVTNWKNGQTPHSTTLKRIADYFGVTEEYFFEEQPEESGVMFWNNYYNLCQQHGSSPNAVAKVLGISSGAVSEWKKGRVPQMATLKKVADYFGVSPDSLVSAPIGPVDLQLFGTKSPSEEMKLTEEEKELLKIFRLIPEDMQKLYLEMGRAYANSLKKG